MRPFVLVDKCGKCSATLRFEYKPEYAEGEIRMPTICWCENLLCTERGIHYKPVAITSSADLQPVEEEADAARS